MRKKIFTLLTLMLAVCSGAWADDIYEYYSSYDGSTNTTINTENFFTGTSFGTDPYNSVTSYAFKNAANEDVTSKKIVKFDSGGSITFTTTAKSTVTVLAVTKDKTSKNGVKLDGNLGTNAPSTVYTIFTETFSDVAAGSHTLTRNGTENGIIYVKVVQEAMTAPAITAQPQSGAYQKDATGKTLTVSAEPSTGACTYQWYSCDDTDKTNPVSLGSGSGAQTAAYTIPTGTIGTFYYYCVVGDGGVNTIDSDVAKVYVLDRAAKQTWDFTTIDKEDIKYNESFWTYKGNDTYNHAFTKATDGTLQDNYGNDLLNGIKVRRDAGDAQVYVYSGKGITLQGASDKPGFWKIPVVSGKYYKITYTSNTNEQTLGYAIESGATFVSGDLTTTITTGFTNTASFIALASATTMVLKNDGTGANYCTIVKIEEATPDYTITYSAGANGSGTVAAGGKFTGVDVTLSSETFTRDDYMQTGWATSDGGDKAYELGDTYSEDASITLYPYWEEHVISGTTIIKVAVTSNTAGTVTGTIGGSATVALQNSDVDGGYKFGGNGNNIVLTLNAGNYFKTGDIINVHTTNAADTNPGTLVIFNGDGSSEVLNTGGKGGLGDNKYSLPSTVNGLSSISVRRTSEYNWNGYVDYIEVYRPNAVVILNTSGFATFSYGEDFEFLGLSGAKAYKMALDEENKTITGTEIPASTKIQAGEGILFKGEAGEPFAITTTTGAEALTDNDLKGSTQSNGTTADKPTYCYVLSGDTFVNYTGAALSPNKAYFEASTDLSANARAFTMTFEDGEKTGINAVLMNNERMNNEVYNLNGQRVAQPTKGLYIVNGKKVVIK